MFDIRTCVIILLAFFIHILCGDCVLSYPNRRFACFNLSKCKSNRGKNGVILLANPISCEEAIYLNEYFIPGSPRFFFFKWYLVVIILLQMEFYKLTSQLFVIRVMKKNQSLIMLTFIVSYFCPHL